MGDRHQDGTRPSDISHREIATALSDAAFKELRVSIAHGIEMAKLPPIHRDPFDRLLVARARHEGLMLVTLDPMMRRYPIETLWD